MSLKRLFSTALIFVSSSLSALEWQLQPYVGVDAHWRRTDYKFGYGNNLFSHTYPQGNAYLGLKFCDFIAAELGYEGARSRTREVVLTTGDLAAGTPINELASPVIFKNRATYKGPHVNLVGFYTPCSDYDFQFLGSVGLVVLKGTFERRTVQYSDENILTNFARRLERQKSILRLTGGFEYKFMENLGIRATIGWENTTRMAAFPKDGIRSLFTPQVKPKNSTIYGLGLVWTPWFW